MAGSDSVRRLKLRMTHVILNVVKNLISPGISLTAPTRFALLQIGLNSFSEIGTTVDPSHYIVEIDSLFCNIQTPLCLLHRPDSERSKRTHLLSDLCYVRHESLFFSNRRQKTTMQSVGRSE